MKKSKIAAILTTLLIIGIFSAIIIEVVSSNGESPLYAMLFPQEIGTAATENPAPTAAAASPAPSPELNIIKLTPTPAPTPTAAPTVAPTAIPPVPPATASSETAIADNPQGNNSGYADSVTSRPVVITPTTPPAPPPPAPVPEPEPEPTPQPVTSITLDNDTLSLASGDIWQINILSAPAEAWDYGFTCSISNSNVVDTVSYGGSSITIQAMAAGAATLTVYGGGYSATCTVSVT